jgi:glycosyltransferase involved in cell wall biosynthesis
VIAEAMIAGLPVLISDQTPWSDIENLGVGFVKKLEDRDGFIDTIQKFSAMSDIDRWKLSDRIIYYVQNTVTNKGDIEAHSQLFILSVDKPRIRN